MGITCLKTFLLPNLASLRGDIPGMARLPVCPFTRGPPSSEVGNGGATPLHPLCEPGLRNEQHGQRSFIHFRLLNRFSCLPSYYFLSADYSMPANLHLVSFYIESVTPKLGGLSWMLSALPTQVPWTGWGTHPPGSGVPTATTTDLGLRGKSRPAASRWDSSLWCCSRSQTPPAIRLALSLSVTKFHARESLSQALLLENPA